MPLADVPAILILVGLSAYIVLAGADFGAPLWSLTGRGEKGKAIREHTHSAVAAVWEANHVWLIFVLVVTWTCYPRVFGSIFSTLFIPLLLAGIGIIIRAISYVVGGVEDRPWVAYLFAFSSVLTPFSLGAVIGAIASGTVPAGNAEGELMSSWLNPTSILIGCLAVVVGAYISAVYLAGDAARKGNGGLADAFRTRALLAGVLAGAVALAGIAVLNADAERIYDGLTSGAGLAAVVVSALCGLGTIALVWLRRYELARFTAAGAVVAIVAGWGIAQHPDLLPGLTIEDAAASKDVLIALLVSVAIGLLILVPSLLLLYGLVLKGRFDPDAELAEVPATEPGTGISGPVGGRRATVTILAIGAACAALTFVFDGGVGLAVGVLGVLLFLYSAVVMLATAVAEQGSE